MKQPKKTDLSTTQNDLLHAVPEKVDLEEKKENEKKAEKKEEAPEELLMDFTSAFK